MANPVHVPTANPQMAVSVALIAPTLRLADYRFFATHLMSPRKWLKSIVVRMDCNEMGEDLKIKLA